MPRQQPSRRERLIDRLGDEAGAILLEGPEFDAAIVGIIERFGQPAIVCYDYAKVLTVLRRQGMTKDDAVEYFDFNVLGAWMGDTTPCFLYRI